MDKLARQEQYWDRASTTKVFSHPIDILRFRKIVKNDARILDYGCGQGRLCGELADFGFPNVMGADYSAAMIQAAQRLYPQLRFSKVDGYSLPYEDNYFDAVLLYAVLTCIPSNAAQQILIEEINRVLRTGGLLLISDYPLQTDNRHITRYKQFEQEFGIFGVFRLSDGGIVRHHPLEWFSKLLAAFSVIESIEMDAKTMNGNPVRMRQIWAKKQ